MQTRSSTRMQLAAGRLWPDWHAQLVGYQVMPAAELLQVAGVTLPTPVDRLLGTSGVRVNCIVCGGRGSEFPGGGDCRWAGPPWLSRAAVLLANPLRRGPLTRCSIAAVSKRKVAKTTLEGGSPRFNPVAY
jgi:hypothetical protein